MIFVVGNSTRINVIKGIVTGTTIVLTVVVGTIHIMIVGKGLTKMVAERTGSTVRWLVTADLVAGERKELAV